MALHERHQYALGRPFIAVLLQNFIKNGAMLINPAPEPESIWSDFYKNLIQFPDPASRTGPPSSQVACDLVSRVRTR